jgi:hypothetical protein
VSTRVDEGAPRRGDGGPFCEPHGFRGHTDRAPRDPHLWRQVPTVVLARSDADAHGTMAPMSLYRCALVLLVVVGCGNVAETKIDAAATTVDGAAIDGAAIDGAAVDGTPVDAGPDAMVDAALPKVYDVVYGSTWELNVDQAVPGWIVIANTGTAALDLSTLRVIGVSDDHPTMNLTATPAQLTTRLAAGKIGGQLTPVSQRVTVDAGLVAAPTVDTTTDYMTFQLLNFTNSSEVMVHGKITIQIGSRTAELPMTFHITPLNGPILFEPSLGQRISAM